MMTADRSTSGDGGAKKLDEIQLSI